MSERLTASERDALVARVRRLADELDGLARILKPDGVSHSTIGASDLRALCAEVELLRDARDAERMLNDVRQADLTRLCDEVERLNGMADAYRTTIADYDSRVGALQDEVERLTRERDEWVDCSLVLASESRVAVLTAEVERLREDAARLDWLKENGLTLVGVNVPLADTGDCAEAWEVRQPVMRGPDEVLAHDTDLRAAIDAARTTGGRDAE